jgi:GH25 family lysozyme M1 (1,4-beta-N-acetylmuramidase)/peptidoglycan hydrolase CwlO-like protein
VGLKIRYLKQLFIILLVVTFTHTTTASAMTFPKDAEIDNARAEIAQSKKELAEAQDVLKKTTEELNKAVAEDKKIRAELEEAQRQREQTIAEINALIAEINRVQAQIDDLVRATFIDGTQQELYLVEAILSSADSNEALSTFNSLQSLLANSSKIIKILNDDKATLEIKEKELEVKEAEIAEKKLKSAEIVTELTKVRARAAEEAEKIKKIVAAQEAILKKLVLAGLARGRANAAARVGPGDRILGSDISRWQHGGNAPINFVKMYDAGVRYIFIKGTDSHPLGAAPAKYWSSIDFPAAREAGLLTGIYHAALIPRGISADAAFGAGQQQADLPIDHLNSLGGLVPGVLPIVLDIESFSRPSGTSAAVVTNFSLGFTARVKERTGKTAIIYSNLNFIRGYLINGALTSSPLWVANYSQTSNPASTPSGGCSRTIWSSSACDLNWTFWQYTDRGNGQQYGIPRGSLDLNVFAFGSGELLAMAGY